MDVINTQMLTNNAVECEHKEQTEEEEEETNTMAPKLRLLPISAQDLRGYFPSAKVAANEPKIQELVDHYYKCLMTKLSQPVARPKLIEFVIRFVREKVLAKSVRLILMRGAFGSGKSITAKLLGFTIDILRLIDQSPSDTSDDAPQQSMPDTMIVELFHFIDDDGFDKRHLSTYYTSCQSACQSALSISGKIVIETNNNLEYRDLDGYRRIAEKANLLDSQILVLEPFSFWKYDADKCYQLSHVKHLPWAREKIKSQTEFLRKYPTTPDIILKTRNLFVKTKTRAKSSKPGY